MNNINNKLINKNELECMINKYIDIYYNKRQVDDPFKLDHILFAAQKKVTLKINSIENIQKAFIHKGFWNSLNNYDEADASSCFHLDRNIYGDYEKAEFQGDKVIDLITLDYLVSQFPTKEVGFLTDLKSRIVRKESLANIAEQLGFKDLILFNSHIDRITKKDTGRDNKRFLEDIFESFIGKLYVDQNYNKDLIKPFLLGVYLTHIDLDFLISSSINYKTGLLQVFHSNKFGHPVYTDLYFLGPVTQRNFVSVILLDKEKFLSSELSKNSDIIQRLKIKKRDILSKLGDPDLDRVIKESPEQIKLDLSNFGANSGTTAKKAGLAELILLEKLDWSSFGNKELQTKATEFINLFKDQFNDTSSITTLNSEFISPYSFLTEILKTHILVGVGNGKKKQEAEQECSKDCLITFGIQ